MKKNGVLTAVFESAMERHLTMRPRSFPAQWWHSRPQSRKLAYLYGTSAQSITAKSYCARANPRFLDWTASTEHILYAQMFRKRNVTSRTTLDRSTRRSAAPSCLIHPICRVKGERVTLSWLRYAQVWQILGPSLRATLIYLPEPRGCLEFLHPCCIDVSCLRPTRMFPQITTLSATRWHLCNKNMNPFPQSPFKSASPEKCRTCCAGNLGWGHVQIHTIGQIVNLMRHVYFHDGRNIVVL